MKRMFLNVTSVCVIAAGSLYLAISPAQAQGTTHTCTAGNGATCTGESCCANATMCYATCPAQRD